MTNEQIFEIADKYGWMDDFNRWNFQGDIALLEFADAIAEAEREACAKVCETFYNHEAKDCAEAIRARGET
jgi:hypothetical protein